MNVDPYLTTYVNSIYGLNGTLNGTGTWGPLFGILFGMLSPTDVSFGIRLDLMAKRTA